jgi:hypothetical protein
MERTEQIRKSQVEQGYEPCFNTIKRRACKENCCWKDACHEYKSHVLEITSDE